MALLLYEKLIPGSQLVQKLQDLQYRVQTLNDAAALAATAEREKPLVVLADLYSSQGQVQAAITSLRQNPATAHVPVIAFSVHNDAATHEAARQAGATFVVSEAAVAHNLPQLLDRVLTEF
ncbi:MAG: hypothetical protein HZA90_17425 [Verrucomicrobia bacterium]|nr:hypothetical protein [Verrucomicrobiota bacterium]